MICKSCSIIGCPSFVSFVMWHSWLYTLMYCKMLSTWTGPMQSSCARNIFQRAKKSPKLPQIQKQCPVGRTAAPMQSEPSIWWRWWDRCQDQTALLAQCTPGPFNWLQIVKMVLLRGIHLKYNFRLQILAIAYCIHIEKFKHIWIGGANSAAL